jgi:hypothetical protein
MIEQGSSIGPLFFPTNPGFECQKNINLLNHFVSRIGIKPEQRIINVSEQAFRPEDCRSWWFVWVRLI